MPCRTDFPDVAVSDFEVAAARSVLAAVAGDGPAKHTNSPVATINAERPLALTIMWQSPHLPVPTSEMRPRAMSRAGQKKGIFGQDRAKAGQRCCGNSEMSPSYCPLRNDKLVGAG